MNDDELNFAIAGHFGIHCPSVPRYTEDLNLIHELEKQLNDEQRMDYYKKLSWAEYDGLFSNARERAEAILHAVSR